MTDDLREKAEKIARQYSTYPHDFTKAANAIETALRDVQRKAIEAAAKVAEDPDIMWGRSYIATAIRALAPTPAGKGGVG